MARTRIPDPPPPELLTLQDVDETLACICEEEREVALLEQQMNATIDRAKEIYAAQAKEHLDAIKRQGKQLKAYAEKHLKDAKDKRSAELNFGSLGYRRSTSCVIPKGTEEAVVARLRELELADCINIKATVNRDNLKQQPEHIVIQTGAYLKHDDTFWYETKQERLQAGED